MIINQGEKIQLKVAGDEKDVKHHNKASV